MFDFIINPDDKFYPSANEWMWNYCTFLGKFTDSEGENYDLGIHINKGYIDLGGSYVSSISDATVHGEEPGDYSSGDFRRCGTGEETREFKLECYRRAKLLNLIKF